MAITAADIKTRFPEFGSLDSTVIDRWLSEAGRNHNVAQWSGKSDDGLAWLTAHFLVAFGDTCGVNNQLGPGPLTSSREGQVAASWSPLTVAQIFREDDLSTTPYGRRYLAMLATVFPTRCT